MASYPISRASNTAKPLHSDPAKGRDGRERSKSLELGKKKGRKEKRKKKRRRGEFSAYVNLLKMAELGTEEESEELRLGVAGIVNF